jgi:hypothetical protein
MKRILIVGWGDFEIYEEQLRRGLACAGADATLFTFRGFCDLRFFDGPIFRKVSRLLGSGPRVWLFKWRFLKSDALRNADFIFFYSATFLGRSFLERIRARYPEKKLAVYTNDNPLGTYRFSKHVWGRFLSTVTFADVVFAYRRSNHDEYLRMGAKQVELLLAYYNSDCARAAIDSSNDVRPIDVLFVGHYEDDGRLECLERIKQKGYRVEIYGDQYSWSAAASEVFDFSAIQRIAGESYYEMLASAKVSIAFLSSINNDEYTRRCFEIPAVGTCMVVKRTNTMLSLFGDDGGVVYFENLLDVPTLVGDALSSSKWKDIGDLGQKKLMGSGHSELDRGRQVLAVLKDTLVKES